MSPITYPARPLNGGKFGLVAKKPVHLWSTKLNGWRALVHTPTGTMFNRHGEQLSIADEFAQALEQLRLSSIEWLDCEALERRHNIGRGSLIILDAILPHLTALERFQRLSQERDRLMDESRYCLWDWLGLGQRPEENRVYLCQQVAWSDASPSGKTLLTKWWGWMQAQNKEWGADFYEGPIAKRADSLYPIQLRSPEAECPFWIKHRWVW